MLGNQNKQYDLVIFGASGYTGQYVIEHVARAVEKANKQSGDDDDTSALKWAVSGRNESKLRGVLSSASAASGFDLSTVPVIICDVKDELSLSNMAAQAKVVLNCVGPYRFSGDPVVKCCVANGTHHVDISGEPQFLETMQLKYNKDAEQNGVYVIGACGFDSIPADVGQMVLHKAMEGPVNKIEMYLKFSTPIDEKGPVMNFGTWQSAIYGLAKASELKNIRRQLYPERLPALKPKLHPRGLLHKNQVASTSSDWCLPWFGSDRSVMMRTQRARYQNDNKRPAQVQCYIQSPGMLFLLVSSLVGLVFGVLAKFKFGRYLLEQYPGFFSLGAVSKKGPSRKMAENTNFTLNLFGQGWKGQDEGSLSDLGRETRAVQVTVTGKNVGYGSTCECMVQAALVILQEKERLPGNGGVLTPGYAFKDSTLVDRLNENQVTFKVKVLE